ncbi:hypothetical protein [Krasilnikovia sp. MM14-A1259]|uniref:hypothetical protein n=1 Tax=Krasilnikovia sp. MM14-A1259 TaxID=3373539 RepID=UPI00380EB304
MRTRALLKRGSIAAVAGALVAGAAAAPASASTPTVERAVAARPAAMNSYCTGRTLPLDCWVTEPVVTQASTTYSSIQFQHGDYVTITGGGCVQTGGSGKTWKRYVDPLADNGLYHGSFHIPGATSGLTWFQYANGSKWYVSGNGGPLVLGYQDDGYGDNGYWGHDDGTGNQCKNVGNAWVHIVISAS